MPTQQLFSDRDARSPARRSAAPALTVVFDLVAPIALYYGLRAGGVGIFFALVVGAAAPAINGLFHAVRHRRVDALAVTVLTLLVLGTALSVIAGSARFLLAKDACSRPSGAPGSSSVCVRADR